MECFCRLFSGLNRNKHFIQSDSPEAWGGLEVQLLRLIAQSLNISLSIHDTLSNNE